MEVYSLEREVARIDAEVKGLRDDITEVKADVKELLAAANRSRGFFMAFLRIGMYLSWISAISYALWSMLRHNV